MAFPSPSEITPDLDMALLLQNSMAWFSALVALLTALATIFATAVTLVVAFLGFRLSQRTHALQKEVQDERREREAQAAASAIQADQIQERAKQLGMQAMVRRHDESERSRIAIVGQHAWFEMVPLDESGRRWRLVNVGTFGASLISITDVSINTEGSWESYPDSALMDLEVGDSTEIHIGSWTDGRLGQMARIAWQEWHGDRMEDIAYREQYFLLRRPNWTTLA